MVAVCTNRVKGAQFLPSQIPDDKTPPRVESAQSYKSEKRSTERQLHGFFHDPPLTGEPLRQGGLPPCAAAVAEQERLSAYYAHAPHPHRAAAAHPVQGTSGTGRWIRAVKYDGSRPLCRGATRTWTVSWWPSAWAACRTFRLRRRLTVADAVADLMEEALEKSWRLSLSPRSKEIGATPIEVGPLHSPDS